MDTENVYGVTPPEALNRTGTIAAPTSKEVSTGAEIESGGVFTVSAREPVVAVALALSVTETEKLEVPVAVGVPVIIPVVAPSESPAGRLPLETLQVYGAVPPEAVNAALL